MADTQRSGRCGSNPVEVQVLFRPPEIRAGGGMADTRDLKSLVSKGREGSSPSPPTSIKLSGILPTKPAARCAAAKGNIGSPRKARLAKRRFEILCDFCICFARKRIFAIMNLRPQIMIAYFNGRLWTTLSNHCGRTKGGHLSFNKFSKL